MCRRMCQRGSWRYMLERHKRKDLLCHCLI
ncbi:hypothetical protein LINGRAHAP2_LOCUS21976 [Linum grandiflorum]